MAKKFVPEEDRRSPKFSGPPFVDFDHGKKSNETIIKEVVEDEIIEEDNEHELDCFTNLLINENGAGFNASKEFINFEE